jgi:hypothetical protein
MSEKIESVGMKQLALKKNVGAGQSSQLQIGELKFKASIRKEVREIRSNKNKLGYGICYLYSQLCGRCN